MARQSISVIEQQTIESMKNIEVYRDEYIPTIKAYAALRFEYEKLSADFEKSGRPYIETFKKQGITHERKSALYQVIESMRKDLLVYENTLGLTPIGVKRIKQQNVDGIGDNALMEFLKNAEI